jgi:CBS domain-containing protein
MGALKLEQNLKDIDFKSLIEEGKLAEIRNLRLRLVQSWMGQKISTYKLCKLISGFNEKVIQNTLTIFSLEFSWLRECTFLEFGSGGRGEQVLTSDQDNGLLWLKKPDEYELEEACQNIIMTLDGAGLNLCPGNVMINNPDWRGDKKQWKERLINWLSNPLEKGPWQFGLILDFTPLFGCPDEALELREELWEYVRTKPLVLKFLIDELQQYRVPLSFWGNFILEKKEAHRGQLNLKKSILAHLTNGVRILALKYALKEVNTVDRIRKLQEAGHIEKSMAQALEELWQWTQLKRIEIGISCLKEQKQGHNYLNPYLLPKDEQKRLKRWLNNLDKFLKLVFMGTQFSV